jgi:hypothetical protein
MKLLGVEPNDLPPRSEYVWSIRVEPATYWEVKATRNVMGWEWTAMYFEQITQQRRRKLFDACGEVESDRIETCVECIRKALAEWNKATAPFKEPIGPQGPGPRTRE